MSYLDRRHFLRIGASAAAASAAGHLLGGPEVALPSDRIPGAGASRSEVPAPPTPATPAPPSTPAGFHRFQLGRMEVTVLNDGYFHLPAEVHAAGVDRDERDRYYASRHLPTDAIPGQLLPILIDTEAGRVLVDAGMGEPQDFAPHTGRLDAALALAGVGRETVDLVVLTHAHGDHFGGLLDPATGESRFPNAEVVVSRPEVEFWTAPDAISRVPDWADMFGGPEAFVQMSAGVLAALGDRLRTVEPDGEIAAGLHAVDSPGHTPGHICVLAESEGEQLLVAGDAIVSVHVGFERPDWPFLFDLDGPEGVRTRMRLLDRAAADGILLSGYHFPFPGVGRVARDGDAYRWLPFVGG